MNPIELGRLIELLEPDELYAALAVHALNIIAKQNQENPNSRKLATREQLRGYLGNLANPKHVTTTAEDREFFDSLRAIDPEIIELQMWI